MRSSRFARVRQLGATLRAASAAPEPDDVAPRPRPAPRPAPERASDHVAWPIRLAAAWSWRLLLIGTVLWFVLGLLVRLRLVAFALVGALFLTALLFPLVRRLRVAGAPRVLSAVTAFVGGLLVVGFVLWFVGEQFAGSFEELRERTLDGVDEIRTWATTGPLALEDTQIQQTIDDLRNSLQTNRESLAAGALSTATIAAELLGGAVLALVATFFFLLDGDRMWEWLVRLFPARSQYDLAAAGRRAWTTLTAYVRGTMIVAAFDAVLIGLGTALLGVPLAVPIAILTFLGAFVPIVGATVTGIVAVLVALVTNGLAAALVLLAVVVAVQQLEGHVLQPLVLGRAVRVHPLAIILAVTAGGVIAGIGGAVVAVPIVAVVKSVVAYYARDRHARTVPELTAQDMERAVRDVQTAESKPSDDRPAGADAAAPAPTPAP
jgi:putative heme transporter